jgi:hypothetical protein
MSGIPAIYNPYAAANRKRMMPSPTTETERNQSNKNSNDGVYQVIWSAKCLQQKRHSKKEIIICITTCVHTIKAGIPIWNCITKYYARWFRRRMTKSLFEGQCHKPTWQCHNLHTMAPLQLSLIGNLLHQLQCSSANIANLQLQLLTSPEISSELGKAVASSPPLLPKPTSQHLKGELHASPRFTSNFARNLFTSGWFYTRVFLFNKKGIHNGPYIHYLFL